MRIPFFSRKTKINNSVLDTVNISGTDAECVPGLTSSSRGISRPMSAKSAYAGVAPVQNGISKIASNAAKAKINLYTFDGEAIIGGPLYDLLNRPNKYCSQRDFCNAFYSWYLMLGEAAVLKMFNKSGLTPDALTILDPSNLRVLSPENPNDIEDVTAWQYIWRDGVIATISTSQLMYAKMFSAGQVRGISPLVSGLNQISAYQGAWTYAAKFFSRGATPNLMVSFPANYGKKNIETAKQMWEDTFGGVDKAWSVLFTTGDTAVEKLDTGLKDALADQILHMAEQDIYQIYSVPPIISGDWANAKYDSAAEQLETFAENTLFPLLEVLTDVLQTQIVDPYVWTGNIIEKKALTTSMKQRFEQAKAEAKEGSIIVLVDPDSLPIMSRIKRASLKNAADAKLAFGLSTKDVDEYFNLGLTLNEYSDLVLFPSNVVTAENLVKPPAPPVAPVSPNADPNAQDPNAQEDPVAQNNARKPSKEEVGAISKALLEMRKYATDQVINDRTLKLRQFEKSISNPILKKECRSIFAQISNALKSCESSIEKQAAIKNVFNSIPRSHLRDLASEIINDVDL